MALVKIDDYYPNYRDTFGNDDIKNFGVYADDGDKIGSVDNVLVDETEGRFRYLIVDTGFWVFGKRVLLPIGRARFDYDDHRVYALGLTKEQAENLPEFTDDLRIDSGYEEQVRGVYRPMSSTTGGTYDSATYANYQPNANETYNYEREPYMYGMNEQNHQNLKLYEERLVANKRRQKAGEVSIGKHTETETVTASVPVEKERVVIERTSPTTSSVANPNEATFREGQVARVEVYEETPDIRKEAFVREEVNVRKEVDRDTVQAQETVRREELDVNAPDNNVINQRRS